MQIVNPQEGLLALNHTTGSQDLSCHPVSI